MQCKCEKNCTYNIFLDLTSIERRLKHIDNNLWRVVYQQRDHRVPFASINVTRINHHFRHALLHGMRLLALTCRCYHRRLRVEIMSKYFDLGSYLLHSAVKMRLSRQVIPRIFRQLRARAGVAITTPESYPPRVNPVTFHAAVKVLRKLVQSLTVIHSRFLAVGPAFQAAASGDHEALKRALEADPEGGIQRTEMFGCTPLHAAAFLGSMECVKLLIEKNCVPRSFLDIASPLHMAVIASNYEVLKVLLRCGLDVNAKDRQGDTPLHVATLLEDVRMVHYLMVAGANVSIPDRQGFKPSYLATMMCRSDLLQRLCFQSSVSQMLSREERMQDDMVELFRRRREFHDKEDSPDSNTDLEEYGH